MQLWFISLEKGGREFTDRITQPGNESLNYFRTFVYNGTMDNEQGYCTASFSRTFIGSPKLRPPRRQVCNKNGIIWQTDALLEAEEVLPIFLALLKRSEKRRWKPHCWRGCVLPKNTGAMKPWVTVVGTSPPSPVPSCSSSHVTDPFQVTLPHSHTSLP